MNLVKESEYFTEEEFESYCEMFFNKYEELDLYKCTFEDLILKNALIMKKTVNDTANFLYKFFNVKLFECFHTFRLKIT
jgi:hypothetical protein